MMRHGLRHAALMAASLQLAVPLARAQSATSTLQGTVTDSGGQVVGGVTVTATSKSTGLPRTVLTSEAGAYFFNFMPPGLYTVTAALTGFKSVRHQNIKLDVGQGHTLDFRLEVGVLEETITVTAEPPPLDRSSPALSTVVGSAQLQAIPLNGRHWSSLMMLAPGAINTGPGTHTSIRFAGRAVDDNNWSFDGVDATGVKDPKQESVARLIIGMDSIAEFRVSSSQYSAEMGSAGGGQIQLLSRSGSNRFRGSVFDFLRDDRFDSRAFGDTADPPPFRMNQFGARLGGPIVKDRTFFFLNYEGIRERLTDTFTGFVPSARFRSAAAPALRQVVDAYPAGQRPTADPDIDEWVTNRRTIRDEDFFMVRFDHRFSDSTNAFLRYSQADADIETPRNIGRENARFRPSNLALQVQHIVSPSVANQLKLGMNRAKLDRRREGPFVEEFAVPGFVTLTGRGHVLEDARSYSLIDDLAIIRGRHNLKLGFEVRRILIDVGDGDTRQLSYSSRPNFGANRLDSFSLVEFEVPQGQRWWYFGYVQDDIKWRPNLTLNLGLRYEYYSLAKEKDGRDKVFALECGGFCPSGTPWYEPDRNNLDPRVGFAWLPARFGGKTVIRGGFGVFHGPGQNDDVFAPLDNAATRLGLDRSTNALLSYPIEPFLAAAATSGVTPRALDRQREDLYVNQYSLSIQQELPWHFVMQVGYVGNQGRHLFSRSYVNTIDPVTGQRPLAQFGRTDYKADDGSSSFNGLQVSLHRSLLNGFLFGGQYMWSHSINDASVGGGDAAAPQNVNDRGGDRGNSAQDIRHTATLNWVWELPWGRGVLGGWQLSGLVQARTGRQLTITVSRSSKDLPDGNSSNQRPDRVEGVPLEPPSGQTPQQWINPAAFAVPPRGRWGTAGRGIMTGPGLFQVDLGLQKEFRIGAERGVAFRWEVFNVFNRANLADPTTNRSAGPSFGLITGPLTRGAGTGGPRQMQFMLRVNF
jgi:outer membrane receptor protein involved in Fe transport